MKNIYKRFLLFFLGCITIRSFLVYLATKLDKQKLKYMGYLALLPAIGFIYIYLTGSRKTGAEVFGGKIWWNNLRPIHSLLYFLFAYLAISNNRNAYIPLLIDVILGFFSFIFYHRIF